MMGYKYQCQDCGFVFEEPKYVYEDYEAYGSPFKQVYATCPKCVGWCLEEYKESEEYD